MSKKLWQVKDKGLFGEENVTDYFRSGVFARDCSDSSNVHEISCHEHHNGSGLQAFGGAQNWPVVSAKIAFREGDYKARDAFAKKLMKFIDENVDPLDDWPNLDRIEHCRENG